MSNKEIEYKYLVKHIPQNVFSNPKEIKQFYIERNKFTEIELQILDNVYCVSIQTLDGKGKTAFFNVQIDKEQHSLIKSLNLLDPNSKSAIRLRTSNEDAFFAIKSKRVGIECVEIETEVDIDIFNKLVSSKAKVGNLIEKDRFIYEYEGSVFEIDRFKGIHKGLTLVEVEVQSVEVGEPKKPKDWVLELTNDKEYFNQYLATSIK